MGSRVEGYSVGGYGAEGYRGFSEPATDFGSGRRAASGRWEATAREATLWESTAWGATGYSEPAPDF